jgi:O-antigen ligase
MKKIEIIFLVLLLLVGFMPAFGAIDKVGFQWLYLSATNFLYIVFKIATLKKHIIMSLNKSVFAFIAFILFSLLSLFVSLNKSESLIELSRLFILLFTLGSLSSIIKNLDIDLNKTIRFITLFLLIETLVFFIILIYKFNIEDTLYLKGIASNINIQAFSIVIKIPLVMFCVFNSKNNLRRWSLIAIWLGVSILFLISSRASLLSLFIIMIAYLIWSSKEYLKNLSNVIKIILPGILLTLLIINPIVNTGEKLSNLTIVNASTLTRLDFYKEALGSIMGNPIFGIGVGNWKLFGIQAHKELVEGYTIPYHAHNDFLQIGSEIGIFGLIAYLLIFIFAFLILKKAFLNKAIKTPLIALGLTLLVYLVDANLNFPISRPIIQVQFLFVLGIIYTLQKKEIGYQLKLNKGLLSVVALCSLVTILSSYKVYDSLRLQNYLLGDFESQKYDTQLDIIESIDDNYPSIGATALPIKAIKANYYKNDSVVNRLLDLASKDNPFIKYPQALKSIRFRAGGEIDSSLYYAKDAFLGLPRNELHIINYFSVLTELKDSITIDSVFNKVRDMDSKNVWNAYLLTNLTIERENTSKMKKVFNEATSIYPEDAQFKLYAMRMTMGDSLINKANELFNEAADLFNVQDFNKSATTYLAASKLIPEDPAYLENAGHGYYMANQNNKALKLFDSVINHYSSKTGKAYYLKGLLLLETKKNQSEACSFFNLAIKRGNPDAGKALKLFCN